MYDALNVLIALGVLRKEGRKIVSDRGKIGLKLEIGHDEKEMLSECIRLKHLNLQTKKRKQVEMTNKLRAVKALLRRNQRVGTAAGARINFPLVGVFILEHEFGVYLLRFSTVSN